MKALHGISPYEAACITIKDSKDEDPFFILDVRDLCKKVTIWREHMPRIKPFYSVKCNDDPEVLKVLDGLGLGFDVASKFEMERVINLGIEPSRLLFAQPCKITSHLLYAKTHGIDVMTFDNEDELHKIKKIYPEARILLRLRYDGNSTMLFGEKFGADPKNCIGLLKLAKELQLNMIGVSFHVGSVNQDGEIYANAIAGCRRVLDQARSLGFTPSVLDIGGGFPQKAGDLFTTFAASINKALDQHFPTDDPIEIIAEPGRYIVGTALSLVTMITSRRLNKTSNGEIKSAMYYINDGIYGSFSTVKIENRIVKTKVIMKTSTSEDDKSITSVVWGPTCDSYDKVISNIGLPVLSVGDWFFWPDMGDYTLAIKISFNGYTNASIRRCITE